MGVECAVSLGLQSEAKPPVGPNREQVTELVMQSVGECGDALFFLMLLAHTDLA